MSVKIFEIRCTKCNKGVFKGVPGKETCTYCGTQITDELIEDDLKQRSQELMIKVEDLKVFEFEAGGEYDCVIARNEEEAKNYYATIIDNIEEYEIKEIKDWHNELVNMEMDEQQPDGTYFQKLTMLEIAKDMYSEGYDGPQTIASSCNSF